LIIISSHGIKNGFPSEQIMNGRKANLSVQLKTRNSQNFSNRFNRYFRDFL